MGEHGTIAAARRHQRAKEPMCPACAAAWSRKNAADFQKHKARIYAKRAETAAKKKAEAS